MQVHVQSGIKGNYFVMQEARRLFLKREFDELIRTLIGLF